MIISTADFSDLKWSLGAFLLSLVVGGGLIAIGNQYQAQALKGQQAAQNQLNEARAQLSGAENDRENMASYAMEYNALAAQKVIGDEQRLDWIEGLERLRQQGYVLDFRYTIAPQQSYTPNPPLDAGDFQLNRSNMSLQIDLLHEEQLVRLFAALHTQMKGWFILDGCTLSHSDPTDDLSTLKAECRGGWFTMKNRRAP